MCSRLHTSENGCLLVVQIAGKLERKSYYGYCQKRQCDDSEHFKILRFWISAINGHFVFKGKYGRYLLKYESNIYNAFTLFSRCVMYSIRYANVIKTIISVNYIVCLDCCCNNIMLNSVIFLVVLRTYIFSHRCLVSAVAESRVNMKHMMSGAEDSQD